MWERRNNRPYEGEDWETSSYDEVSRERYRRQSYLKGGGGGGASERGIDIVFIWLLIPFAVALGALIWYQVIDARNLSTAGEDGRTNYITLHAKRGTIYDRNGKVLAVSVDCKSVTCNPVEVNDALAISRLLAETLGGEQVGYYEDLTTDGVYAMIAERIDLAQAKRLEEALDAAGLTGIYFIDDTKRDYPFGNVCGQVLGVVGNERNVDTGRFGLSGLEYEYDDYLAGEDGMMVMQTGAGGTPIAGAPIVVDEAKNGMDLVLSIDIDVQQVAEREIEAAVKQYKAESGTAIVTDPRTGEILAACSTPLMNPLDFPEVDPSSMTLKPVTSSYEPGSVFKVITSAIGIDGGYVTPWSTYYVPHEVEVGDDLVYDDDDRDYDMNMTLTEMMRRSSNTGLATVAQESIGAEAFAEGVERFGIGHETGIDFPGESAGIVRKLWQYDGSTLGSNAFGQGLSFPMFQIVRAIGAIANEGYPCTPHFVVYRGDEELEWPQGEQIVSKTTCDLVIDMMRVVVQDGTAKGAQVSGYDVAGKTGTGEQADEAGGYKEDSFMASLIGFAPASEPQVLVYVGLNGTPYLASASAAHTFSSIMGEALVDMEVVPTS